MTVRSFRDLRVYASAVELRREVFRDPRAWPKEERYSLTDQVRRSSRSVGANIAEAWSKRRYPKHFVAKLTDTHGEAEETGVWLDTALECGYLEDETHAKLRDLARSAAGGLASMIRSADKWSGSSTGSTHEPSTTYDFDSPPPLEGTPPLPHTERPSLEGDPPASP